MYGTNKQVTRYFHYIINILFEKDLSEKCKKNMDISIYLFDFFLLAY